MRKQIREVDEKQGIVQITTADERWYVRDTTDPETGLPKYSYVPSVTWITGHYPKGVEFYKWLASKGWDESQAIKQAAGDKGSKVHYAITHLLNGFPVAMDAKFLNPSTGQEEELTLEEYECLMAFADWHNAVQPVTIANEIVVWNDKYGYAGTIDFICEINGHIWIIDFKTSQQVWPEYELQVSAYKHAMADGNGYKLGILQVGYKRNKSRFKFTEVEDKFDLFLAARMIWRNECETQAPHQKDYPLALSLTHGKDEQGADESSEDLPEAPIREEAPRRRRTGNRTTSSEIHRG